MLPDVSGFDKAFDYLAPPRMQPAAIGTVVRVPLGGRQVRGWVVGHPEAAPEGVDLRELAALVSRGPDEETVELCRWAAWRWAGPLRPFLHAASAPRIVPLVGATATRGPAGEPAGEPGRQPMSAHPARRPDEAGGVASHALAEARAVVRLPPSYARTDFVRDLLVRIPAERSVLVLTESRRGAEALARALAGVGDRPVALQPEEWRRAADEAAVVVGTRAAVLAPLRHPAAIVVLDAHSEALVETRSPNWSAWLVAAERARRASAPCILATPCPSAEQLAWGTLVQLPPAEEQQSWPAVEVIDRRGEDPRAGRYPSRLAELIREARAAVPGRPAVVVLNRTGQARLLACKGCGALAACGGCGRGLERRPPTELATASTLDCAACGTSRPVICAECGSMRLAVLRVGTARAAVEIEALTGLRTLEVTARTREDWQTLRQVPVLVGTEAVLHRALAACVVAFLDFDAELMAQRMRAPEQALALVAAGGRLVGGRDAGGRVAIQTGQPGHEVIRAAELGDPGILAAAETGRRRRLGLPPYSAVARIDGRLAGEMAVRLGGHPVEVADLGGGRFLVKAPDHEMLCDALASARPADVGVRVVVDPLDL